MSVPVVVFTTYSDIEASVVMALLDSQGIESFRASGNPQAIWPMAVNALGPIRVAVAEALADEARRIIESHREDVGSRVVRLRDEFDELQRRIGYRFRDRGLLEHALTHRSRAAEDVSGGMADNESLEFLGDAVLGLVVADALFRQYPAVQRGTEVEDQGVGRVDAVAGAARGADAARRTPDARARRGEDGRPLQAGAARRRLRGADRGDLSRWRARGGAGVSAARAEGCAR